MKLEHLKQYVIISLINFVIAALMGLLLRYVYLGHSIPFQYHNLLHAHSHIALLGWLYMILFALWVYHYLDFDKKIRKLFWITQATVIGMMISFPLI